MTARATILIVATAMTLAGCGKKTLALPEEPVDRAATCGVVAAAKARTAAAMGADLPIAAQGQILHYALLAAAETEPFAQERLEAVVARMPALEPTVTKGKWQELEPACAAAYPPAAITTPTLPDKALDAELGCYVLAQFMAKSLAANNAAYSEPLSKYGAMTRKLDTKVAGTLQRSGVAAGSETRDERQEALGGAAKLGSPIPVLDACVARYG